MIPRAFLSALLSATTAHAVCTAIANCPQYLHLKTDSCQTYHHFLARGSQSPYPGHVIETVGKVCDALNTPENPNACGYEDVIYPAETGGEAWCASSHQGALNGAAQMNNYTERCPDSHLIVMAFSQGSSVMLDVLGGGGGEMWGCMQKDNPNMNITTAPGSKVAAALMYGPSRRNKGKSWTVGGGNISDGSGVRTDEENAGLQPYADKGVLREYCQPGDPICAPYTENTDMSLHLNYFDKYGDEAAAWVIQAARKASSADKNNTTPAKTSGAKEMLHKTITHPIANVFLLLFVLFGLYFLVRKFAVWRTTKTLYARVSTNETV